MVGFGLLFFALAIMHLNAAFRCISECSVSHSHACIMFKLVICNLQKHLQIKNLAKGFQCTIGSSLANIPPNLSVCSSGGSRGRSRGAQEPPFGLVTRLPLGCTYIVALRKCTDVKLNGTPPSGYRTKKTAAMVELVVCLKNERNGRGFAQKWAWLLKIRTQPYIRTTLLEILDLPLCRPGDSGLGA